MTDPADDKANRRRDWAWYLAIALASSAWCLTAASRTGVTYDERLYLRIGVKGWVEWSNYDLVTNGTMPLPTEVHTSVLYAWTKLSEAGLASKPPDPVEELPRALPYARAMNLIFWWVLLWHIQNIGRFLAGKWAGRLALVFTASDPTLLAHAALATTDIPLAAACTALVSTLMLGRNHGVIRRLLLPGFWLGIAADCKVSGFVYGLIAIGCLEGFTVVGEFVAQRRIASRALLKSTVRVMIVTMLGLGLLLACTGFTRDNEALKAVAERVPATSSVKPEITSWSQTTAPVPNAFAAFAFQFWQNHDGRLAYLLGTIYPGGWLYYFPVLLLLKIPIPVMFLAAAVTLLRPRGWLTPVTAIALMWLLAALPSKVQIGIRLILPVMALGYAALAVAVIRGWPVSGWRIGLLFGTIFVANGWWAWPHGLSYSNGLGDGGAEGFHRFSDSNLDWGQGIPDLKRWHARNCNDSTVIAIWYFGQDPRCNLPPFRHYQFSSSRVTSVEELKAEIGTNMLAVGTTAFTDYFIGPGSAPGERFVRDFVLTRQPVGRTPTFLIYNLDESPPRATPIPPPNLGPARK